MDKTAYRKPFSTVHAEPRTFVESVWPDFVAVIPELVGLAETTTTPPKKSGMERGRIRYLPHDDLAVHIETPIMSWSMAIAAVPVAAPK